MRWTNLNFKRMNNITKYFLSLLFLMLSLCAYSQNGQGRDKIKSLKVAFITERVGLTSSEATSFWPVYNEHEEALGQLRRNERREVNNKINDLDLLTEDEIDKVLDTLLDLEAQKQELNASFLSDIRKIISPKKTFLLIRAEIDFKKRLLQEMQKRRRGER